MGKGDLKLEVRGNVDFLTDFPQISYFDVLYKRYTNFATEMIYLPLSGSLEFGEVLTCILPKYGDLIHKMYFALTLSSVSIPRLTNISGLSRSAELSNYNYFLNFINIIYPVYRNIIDEQTNINFNISDIITILDTIASTKSYTDIQGTSQYYAIFGTHYDFVNEYKNLTNKMDAFDSTTGKLNLATFVNFVSLTKIYDQKLFLLSKEFGTKTNYYFSWKEKIGHLLLEQIDLEIGGQKIDRQFTDWLNILVELTSNPDIIPTYRKMIGDIDILTTYDSNAKPQYQVLVPLQFFFNKYLECALPIIFFRYHEVKISIKLNNLYNIINVDPALITDNVNIDNYVRIVDARLLTEYIYLDEDERVKFATYAHEYLVDYVQESNADIISQAQTINFDYFNSVKSMYFTIQSNQSLYYKNYNYNTNIIVEGTITSNIITINNIQQTVPIFIIDDAFVNQFVIDSTLIGKYITFSNTKFYNNTYKIVTVDNNKQFQFNGKYEGDDTDTILTYNLKGPLNTFELLFESYPRQKRLDGDYLNYIIPYKCHTSIPTTGIYTYTFSLSPENYQPSGSCNYSALRYKSINLTLKDEFWDYASQYDSTNINKAKFKMYGLTYNILRLANGMGALYFSS
jgi:hypothetical protein